MYERLYLIRQEGNRLDAFEYYNKWPGNLYIDEFYQSGETWIGIADQGGYFLGVKIAKRFSREICLLKFVGDVTQRSRDEFYAGLRYKLRIIRGLDSSK